jgi:hypothetical protein
MNSELEAKIEHTRSLFLKLAERNKQIARLLEAIDKDIKQLQKELHINQRQGV